MIFWRHRHPLRSPFRLSPFAAVFAQALVCLAANILYSYEVPHDGNNARKSAYAPELTNQRKFTLAFTLNSCDILNILDCDWNHKTTNASLVSENFGFSIKSRIEIYYSKFTVDWHLSERMNLSASISFQYRFTHNQTNDAFPRIRFCVRLSSCSAQLLLKLWIFRTDCTLQNAHVLHWFQRFRMAPMAPNVRQWLIKIALRMRTKRIHTCLNRVALHNINLIIYFSRPHHTDATRVNTE